MYLKKYICIYNYIQNVRACVRVRLYVCVCPFMYVLYDLCPYTGKIIRKLIKKLLLK